MKQKSEGTPKRFIGAYVATREIVGYFVSRNIFLDTEHGVITAVVDIFAEVLDERHRVAEFDIEMGVKDFQMYGGRALLLSI